MSDATDEPRSSDLDATDEPEPDRADAIRRARRERGERLRALLGGTQPPDEDAR